MHEVKRSAIVPYSVDKMYQLVNDIECYPEFLPWCKQSEILQAGQNEMLASLTINKGPFNQRLTTRNVLSLNKRIEMHQDKGPFDCFEADWDFKALESEACHIHFYTQFAFKSRLLDMTVSSYFSQIANAMLDAFIDRANRVYAGVS